MADKIIDISNKYNLNAKIIWITTLKSKNVENQIINLLDKDEIKESCIGEVKDREVRERIDEDVIDEMDVIEFLREPRRWGEKKKSRKIHDKLAFGE